MVNANVSTHATTSGAYQQAWLGLAQAIAPPPAMPVQENCLESSFYQSFIEQSLGKQDLQAALRALLNKMLEETGADRGFLAIMDDEGSPLFHVVCGDEGDPHTLFPYSRSIIERVRAESKSVWISNAQDDERFSRSRSIISLQLATVIAVPLRISANTIGVIYLEHNQIVERSEPKLARIEALAGCASFAIANDRSYADLMSRLQKFQIINEVSLAITATIQLEQLLKLIITHSLSLSGGDQGYILLGENESLECLASLDKNQQPIAHVQISRSVVSRCLNENRSICILDTAEDEVSQSASVMALDLRSVMCVPLIANQERLGVLYISSNAITKTFTPQDQSLLESIATQAALTIRNAQLLKEQEGQIIQLEEALSKYRQAERDATTDMLTGLHNRRYVEDIAIKELEKCRRYNRSMGVILLDVDHFKKFNDTYGHAIGDEVLKLMGNVLPEGVRAYDTPARFGGEEFVVLLPDTDSPGALAVAERIRQLVSEVKLNDQEGKPVGQITASLGVATLLPTDKKLADLLERADTALYACKAGGRNQVRAWQPDMPTPEELKRREAEAAGSQPS